MSRSSGRCAMLSVSCMIGSTSTPMSIRNMRGKLQYRITVRGLNICKTTQYADTAENRILVKHLEQEHRRRVLAGEWEESPISHPQQESMDRAMRPKSRAKK